MIEMYKILTAKYDVDVTPKVLRVYNSTTRGNMFKLNKFEQSMTCRPCVNFISLTRWLMFGTVS